MSDLEVFGYPRNPNEAQAGVPRGVVETLLIPFLGMNAEFFRAVETVNGERPVVAIEFEGGVGGRLLEIRVGCRQVSFGLEKKV